MAETVELQFEGGSVEVEVNAGDAASRGFGDEVVRVTKTFDESLDGMRGLANGLHKTMAGMISPPDAVTVEFGLSINAAAKFVVTSAGGSANLRVVMQWTRKQTKP